MSPVDLTGIPPPWPGWLRQEWAGILAATSADDDGSSPWPRRRSRGEPELLAALGRQLGVAPERLVVTVGIRAAAIGLATTCRRVFVERPTFVGVPELLRHAGHQVTHGPWDALVGLAAARRPLVDLVWVTSPARNPDGATLRRAPAAALDHLAGQGVRVVVNEAYRWYEPAAPPPTAIRVGSLSKLVGGGVGLGWVVDAPDGVLAAQRAGPPTLWQRCWARLLTRAGDRLPAAFVDPVVTARQAFVEAFPSMLDASSGPSLLLRCDRPEQEVLGLLEAAGVIAGAGSDFLADHDCVRFCFTAVSPAAARAAGERLTSLTRRYPRLVRVPAA